MSKLSRRLVILGAAATSAVGTIKSTFASTPTWIVPAGAKNMVPIFCRHKSADFEITHIVDENYPFPGSQHPAAVTRELSGDETGIARMRRGQAGVPFNFIVINTGLKLILPLAIPAYHVAC